MHGRYVDSFRDYRPGMLTQCAFKGCRNSARIVVYFTLPGSTEQDRRGICKGCALNLANQSIAFHKFGKEN